MSYARHITIRISESIRTRLVQESEVAHTTRSTQIRRIIRHAIAMEPEPAQAGPDGLPPLEELPRRSDPAETGRATVVTVRLSERDLDAVDLAARRAGQSRSSFLRDFVSGYLDPYLH